MHRPRLVLPALAIVALALAWLAWTRGGGAEPAAGVAGEGPPAADLPGAIRVEIPAQPIEVMEVVEDYSEEVANRMVDFSDKLRRRDFRAALGWLTPDFAGHGFSGLAVAEAVELPLGATRRGFDPASAPILGPEAFLASLRDVIGPWERVESVLWKVKGAEFQPGSPLWGRIRFKVAILGTGSGGGPESLVAWGHARVERRGGRWSLHRFELESLELEHRDAFLFTDVSTSGGVAHAGVRFGQEGNDRFAWNGAAAGDADGDGLFDLYVPSDQRNFLYMALEGGGFRDEGGKRGVADSTDGTGCVFFDWDDDGDQDLAVADVGREELDGTRVGNPLRFYRNDGTGRFAEVGSEVGFDALCYGYTLVVLDAELDGHPDVLVCNYGVQKVEPNNSWIDATNGMSNILYGNEGGERFVDVTAEAGVRDRRWTYAGAAADYDLDGDSDLYLANDYATNILWRNRGDGTFEDATGELAVRDLGNGMGCAWGDLDSDGQLDLYVSNMSSTAGNRIIRRLSEQTGRTGDLLKMAAGNTIFLGSPGSNGDGVGFQPLPPSAGGTGASWAWAPALFDLDLDGRLDVFCANGFVTGDTAADT